MAERSTAEPAEPVDRPRISVVLVVGDRRQRASRALRSVLGQEGIEEAEVVVVDAGAPAHEPLTDADHPRVRVLHPQDGQTYGGLRALGVWQSQGESVAFLEDHSLASPGWLRGLDTAFDDAWAAVGASCLPTNPGVGWSDAVGMLTYGRWWPPVESGEVDLLPGNNSAFRRSELVAFGEKLEALLSCDTLLQWRLSESGRQLYLAADVMFGHQNEVTAGSAVASVFHYHRCFARHRATLFEWTRARRFSYLLLSFAIPWRRWLRSLGLQARATGRGARLSLLDWLRVLLLLHAAVIGQAAGLLFGFGDSRERLVDVELNIPRPGFDDHWSSDESRRQLETVEAHQNLRRGTQ